MRIQKNHTSPTFKSIAELKKICEETLVEFHQEFPRLKSPTKLWQDSENAGCETKRNLFKELHTIWSKKYKALKLEYVKYEKNEYPSYDESMEKLKELMKEHGVSNCGYMNNYYQYMLAKKGVYSECSGLEVFSHAPMFASEEPIKNHLYLYVKESEKAPDSLVADSWLNCVEDVDKFEPHIIDYMQLDPKKQFICEDRPILLQGYDHFLSRTKSKQNNITSQLQR